MISATFCHPLPALISATSCHPHLQVVAKALALECMRAAKAQERGCYVFAFAGPQEVGPVWRCWEGEWLQGVCMCGAASRAAAPDRCSCVSLLRERWLWHCLDRYCSRWALLCAPVEAVAWQLHAH